MFADRGVGVFCLHMDTQEMTVVIFVKGTGDGKYEKETEGVES